MTDRSQGDAHTPFPPRGCCDSHVHVIGPKSRYPLAAARSYTPADATTDALKAMMTRVGCDRAVIVQPSVYGADNSCTLDALREMAGVARGVAVPAETAAAAELDVMHRLGVRGIRLNAVSGGMPSQDALGIQIRRAGEQCVARGWHLQIFALPAAIEAMAPAIAALPVPVVLDHFGMIRPGHLDSEAFRIISRLMAEGKAWVKLSGFYRIAADPFDPAIGPLARRFFEANPERVVWASDWPHTPPHSDHPAADDQEQPYQDIDTRGLLYRLQDWFTAPELQRILVDNPARLYDFS